MNKTTKTLLDKLKQNNKPEKISIAGFDEPLYIRRITLAEQAEIAKFSNEKDELSAPVVLMAFGVCDETGERLFSVDDMDELKQLDLKTVLSIVNHINRVNGFHQDVEQAEKN